MRCFVFYVLCERWWNSFCWGGIFYIYIYIYMSLYLLVCLPYHTGLPRLWCTEFYVCMYICISHSLVVKIKRPGASPWGISIPPIAPSQKLNEIIRTQYIPITYTCLRRVMQYGTSGRKVAVSLPLQYKNNILRMSATSRFFLFSQFGPHARHKRVKCLSPPKPLHYAYDYVTQDWRWIGVYVVCGENNTKTHQNWAKKRGRRKKKPQHQQQQHNQAQS